ncbi:MAG: aldo/keto reductase [bacterium (Candidatus Ratteibacteria) CG_4_10_14_3_um_filter_41_18]|uniref:Aldo/keto reductase n=4 Tax=Candidatus Ratteibacteria TaxID=2979319 RepID=A0A2M7E6N8_9BACT|nr:MAG: aldo/keto reductase [Candidatus Omnitrophica bacterium CG1_02_41_171]PIV63384.1 MAG: aldo/keto reductase [bacterium (Candidatus Ratteibacteria) CG01_land_8_20_14_3_00_40_19]PIW33402.1 MAG: aldo/keto reductase [bacterium (Candidatus Ratteibacteria) CG15_BIG_FIL_POST_REV_8_21_14_020_41_12]PIW74136.1 MAG: aldo/keto reductase [bacterium (Candidatus Ratteibacteria) CG_4_8_14_3_um_filter_41_36]PIX76767.1 MAG: aldo/keto reductase [bacterium (Candidatus Ratteibacteria) CG_4_10_14_3_um_filter_41
MRTKKLGNTELNLSAVGFGSWAIGGGGWKYSWGPQDDRESIAAILHAIEKGINWIDTAAVYGLGHSEDVVGKAIRELPAKPIIATKCSRIWDRNGNLSGCLKEKSIRWEVEASLKRLNIDVIDLYQIHWPEPEKDIEEAWRAIADLIKEGKIRYGGVSNFSVEQLKRIQPIHPVASLQPPYSMLKRGIEDELLDYCAANKIGVIVYSPMQKGLLAGKFSRKRVEKLPADDHRRGDPSFQEPRLGIHLQLVEGLRPIAERNGKTLAQLAIAWVLRRPEITAAIVGTRNPSQIEETAIAGDWVLSEKDISDIELLLKKHDKALEEIR